MMQKYKGIRFFGNKISFLLDKRSLKISLSLLVVTIFVLFLSIALGDMKLAPLTLWKVLVGGGTEMEQLVIYELRLPRILTALFAGMALAVAGGILQGMIRNPLASPDIIGITAGASAAVVGFLTLFSDVNNSLTVGIHWLPFAAFIGATIAAFLVYFLAWRNGVAPVRLILIGIGISALMQALTTMAMILGPIYRASQANIWITGTVHGSSWENVMILVPLVTALLIISFLSSRQVNVQGMGDELATGIGSSVQKQRFFLLLISTGLVGVAVAFVGGIGFVGLMAPHMARKLVGSSFEVLLPTSAFLGAILVMLADLIGRTMFLPLEVPAGVFTAAIGAPYFIYLLYKTKNK